MKTGIAEIAMNFTAGGWKTLVMLVIACVLLYLAIVKKFEPLLLLPIAFGMLLANLPLGGVMHPEYFINPEYLVNGKDLDFGLILHKGGLLDLLYLGVKLGIYPPLIFLGIGCMTDFGPLISNPKSILLGAAAQLGVFITFFCAVLLGAFGIAGFGADGNVATIFKEAASIGIIGGADGPTAIFVTKTLAPGLLSAIAIAAYSYMALIPMIQPPIMKALTSKKERQIVMEQLRPVTQKEKIIFPIAVALIVVLLVPDAASLVGMLMLGNLIKESGVAERLCKTAQNELMNIVTIFLGITVGATATADTFLTLKTLFIVALGLVAFMISTMGGLLLAKLMCRLTGGKINPLIGSAGVSAVPMAARMSQKVGQEENPANFLLMHAMGPNVAGVIGSAVAAGVFLANFTGI
ncbi:MAG: sodium ion-translocating decarboxylase subunit beta [Clostridia bacterium]|nr:sodium ion-translocating decarboxylase subunit beta [Clostridia bacterium]